MPKNPLREVSRPGPHWLTTGEYAKKYSVGVGLVHSWIRRKMIAHIRKGHFNFVADVKPPTNKE